MKIEEFESGYERDMKIFYAALKIATATALGLFLIWLLLA